MLETKDRIQHNLLQYQKLLVKELSECVPDQLARWIKTHRANCNLELITILKDCSYEYLFTDPPKAKWLAECALQIAATIPEDAVPLATARWAMANWALLNAPNDSIALYEQAAETYQKQGDHYKLSLARIQAALVGVYGQCGQFEDAETAYNAARPELETHFEQVPDFLFFLELNYSWNLYEEGRYAESLEINNFACQLAQKINKIEYIVESEVNRALALAMLGRLAECEPIWHQLGTLVQQDLTKARVEMNIGEFYAASGQPAPALRYLLQARRLFSSLENLMEAGSVAMREGWLLQQIGAFDAAQRRYEEAYSIFTKHRMRPQMGQVLVYSAIVVRLLDDYSQSEKKLEEADCLWGSLENKFWLSVIHLERLENTLSQGDAASAKLLIQNQLPVSDNLMLIATYQMLHGEVLRLFDTQITTVDVAKQIYLDALNFAQEQNYLWIQRRVMKGLGQLLYQSNPEQGFYWIEAAVAIDERIRQQLSVEELKANYHVQASDLFQLLVCWAIDQKQIPSMLSYIWQAKAAPFLELLQVITANRTLSEHQKVEFEQTRGRLAALRWQLALQANTGLPDFVYERKQPNIQQAEQALFNLRLQRNQQFAIEDLWLRKDSIQLITQMNADGLLEYMVCGNEILGVYIDKDYEITYAWLTDTETILDLLERIRLNFQNVLTQSVEQRRQPIIDWRPSILRLLRQCYNLLIAPLLPQLSTKVVNRLLIAPCYPLTALPFAAFWDDERYLIERYELEMILSGALLRSLAPSALNIGPPLIIGASTADTPFLHSVNSAIKALFPNTIDLLDKMNTVQALRDLSMPPRILHVTTHSIHREDAPIFSALQLNGELLTVEQCYDLSLAGTELVTLMSCDMAAGLESGGALLAFQTALFVAGVRHIISTIGPVQAEAAATWMTYFYESFVKTDRIAATVRQTQLAFLREPAYAHPALWATFVCNRR